MNMTRRPYFVFLVAILLITGCAESKRSLPINDDHSINSSLPETKEALPSVELSKTHELSSPTATLESSTDLPQEPLVSYVVYGGDGEASSELNTCINWLSPYERFLLHDDGQLLQYKTGSILEARLSPVEIRDLLTRLERTGFHDIEETSESPDRYDIYNLPDDFQYGDGGWGRSITIQGQRIHIRDSLWEYIIPSIEDTLAIIESYEPPGGAAPYVPKKIEVFVLRKDSGLLPDSSFISASEWPSELPPIDRVWFLDEAETALLLNTGLYTSFPDIRAFIYEGTEYVVVACPSRN
jgi:hypothetical protein